jgi:hypothetical protein
MKVKDLIAKLKLLNENADVTLEYRGGNGCDTCGWGSETEDDLVKVVDLETRIVLSTLY